MNAVNFKLSCIFTVWTSAVHGNQVYIVDDDTSMREALLRALQRKGYAARAFATSQALLEVLEPAALGVIVLDVQMPGMNGLDLQQSLAAMGSHLPIILISGQSQPKEIIQGMKNEATDFLLKPFTLEALFRSVDEALDKARTFEDARNAARDIVNKYERLSNREREVFCAIGEGELIKAIALRLGVSNSVIKFHKANIMRKLDCSTLSDLMAIFLTIKRERPM